MELPTISVITISMLDPVGLQKTIDSVVQQRGDFSVEHIVVDGGSGDDVVALLKNYENANQGVVWISEPDKGRYDAMNKGIARASGSMLWFMHSGDTFGSDFSIQQMIQSTGCNEATWGYGFARLYDGEGVFGGIFGNAPFNLRRFSLGGRSVPHQACYFGKSTIAALGPYSNDHGVAEDQFYILRAALQSAPVITPELICNFDTTGVGTARPAWDHFHDMAIARRVANYRLNNSRALDLAATLTLTVLAIAQQKLHRLLSHSVN